MYRYSPGAVHRLGPIVKASGVKKALIITDTTSHRHLVPIVQTVTRELFSAGMDCSLFDEVGVVQAEFIFTLGFKS